jgi:type VI secretion system secreted protein Hcp
MALDMFMRIDSIPGESKDPSFLNSIDMLAWSWGLSNTPQGTTGGKPNLQDLSFTKYVDVASPLLFRACALGLQLKNATLSVRKPGTKPFVTEQYALQDVLITALSTGGSGGEDRLTENVTMHFGIIKFTYTRTNAGGGPGAVSSFGYNAESNTPL